MKRNKFIVLEGIDRSGKTSIAKLLSAKLNAETFIFPERSTIIGKMLDGYLKTEKEFVPQVQHLLFSANRWEVADKILKTLESKSVVCDRYYYSGIVYSLLHNVEYEWAKQSDKGLPEPDLVAFIDIKPEAVMERDGYGNERYDSLETQKKVYNLYKSLFEDYENVKFFNGDQSSEKIAQDIFDFAMTED